MTRDRRACPTTLAPWATADPGAAAPLCPPHVEQSRAGSRWRARRAVDPSLRGLAGDNVAPGRCLRPSGSACCRTGGGLCVPRLPAFTRRARASGCCPRCADPNTSQKQPCGRSCIRIGRTSASSGSNWRSCPRRDHGSGSAGVAGQVQDHVRRSIAPQPGQGQHARAVVPADAVHVLPSQPGPGTAFRAPVLAVDGVPGRGHHRPVHLADRGQNAFPRLDGHSSPDGGGGPAQPGEARPAGTQPRAPRPNSPVPLTRPEYVPSMMPRLPGRASRADPGRDALEAGLPARHGPVVGRDPLCTPR